MAAAWDQVGEMQRANQERRQIDVALAVGDAAMRRHIALMSTDRVLQVSAPSGVPTSGGLAAAAVVADIPPATLSGAFRRLQRRTGSLARRSAPTPPGARLTMMALPQPAGASTMTVIGRFRLLQAAPDLVAQKKAAVLPFSDADAVPVGHSSAHATFRSAARGRQTSRTAFRGRRPSQPLSGIWRVGAVAPRRFDAIRQRRRRRRTGLAESHRAQLQDRRARDAAVPVRSRGPAYEYDGDLQIRAAERWRRHRCARHRAGRTPSRARARRAGCRADRAGRIDGDGESRRGGTDAGRPSVRVTGAPGVALRPDLPAGHVPRDRRTGARPLPHRLQSCAGQRRRPRPNQCALHRRVSPPA